MKKSGFGYSRNQLLADIVNICLTAALLRFQGVKVDSTASITGVHSPDKGRYIQDISKVSIRVFLQDKVYVFRLKQSAITPIHCDLLLTVEIHNLDSNKLETEKLILPIWVFWYRPTNEAIAQATIYLKSHFSRNVKPAIIFYLQIPPSNSLVKGEIEYFIEQLLCLLDTRIFVDSQVFTSHSKLKVKTIDSLHAKVTLLGNKIAYIGGINFNFGSNAFSVTDLMYKTTDSEEIIQIRQQLASNNL